MTNCPDIMRLFAGEEGARHHFHVLRKKDQFVLFVPSGGDMADATLRLYPAQRVVARSVLSLIRKGMRLGFTIFSQKANFPINEHTPFARFLKGTIQGSQSVPNFGFLDNRIKESGRPCVLLLFDSTDRPATVIKVGTSEEARQLIRGEQQLFFPQRPDFPGLPEALDWYENDEATAIAYRYVEGAPPHPRQHGKIESVLNSWIWRDEATTLDTLPIWPRLETLLQENPGLESIFQALHGVRINPVLFHGDFAPWNIRVRSSSKHDEWVVLDWERGNRVGIPGWDWLNFTVQYNTWVRGLSADVALSEIESLFQSLSFQDYALRTGIQPILHELTFLYLLYSVRYCYPRSKASRIQMLAQKFNAKYFPDVFSSMPPLKIHPILAPHFEKFGSLLES